MVHQTDGGTARGRVGGRADKSGSNYILNLHFGHHLCRLENTKANLQTNLCTFLAVQKESWRARIFSEGNNTILNIIFGSLNFDGLYKKLTKYLNCNWQQLRVWFLKKTKTSL